MLLIRLRNRIGMKTCNVLFRNGEQVQVEVRLNRLISQQWTVT